MQEIPDIAIIGAGKVGTAIGVLAHRAKLRVVAVAGRRRESAQAAAEAIGPDVRVCTPKEAAAAGGLVLLTVHDEAIEGLCDELARCGAFAAGSVVAHCSGVLGSEILASARRDCGCAVGSMHPLQTFPTAEAAVEKFTGVYCFCEGDARAVAALEQLASAIGGIPVRMDRADKPLYHAAAVMGCNYLAALIDAALGLAEKAGIDRKTALAAMEPLLRATIDNIMATGPAEALTGPIARGEIETVRRHLEAIGRCRDELGRFYRAAGEWTVDLARSKGTIDETTAKALKELLDANSKKE